MWIVVLNSFVYWFFFCCLLSTTNSNCTPFAQYLIHCCHWDICCESLCCSASVSHTFPLPLISWRLLSESCHHTVWNVLLIWTALVLWYCMHSQHTILQLSGHTTEHCQLCCDFINSNICYFGCLHSCLMKTLHHLRKVNVFVFYIWRAVNLSCITFPLFCIWSLYMSQLVLEFLLRTLARFFHCFLCVNTHFVFYWTRFTCMLWASSKRLLCSCSADCPSIRGHNICVVLANMLRAQHMCSVS